MMNDGRVFVRACPGCSKRHQTADQSGATQCDECLTAPSVPAPAPSQPTAPGGKFVGNPSFSSLPADGTDEEG